MEKTVLEWLNELPDGYRELALSVVGKEYEEDKHDSIEWAIHGFGFWDKTPQGEKFWGEVFDVLKGKEPLPPLSELNHLRRDVVQPAEENYVKEERYNTDIPESAKKVIDTLPKYADFVQVGETYYSKIEVNGKKQWVVGNYWTKNNDVVITVPIENAPKTPPAPAVNAAANTGTTLVPASTIQMPSDISHITAASRIPHKPTRPAHYGGEENVYEPIKVIRAWGLEDDFYLANVLKYIARRNAKGDYAGDVAKAAQYMEWKIEQLNGKQK